MWRQRSMDNRSGSDGDESHEEDEAREQEEEEEDEEETGKREIGKLAVWSVSTAKPGNGVELLRDDNLESFWQSDGPQPHLVNIQFQKKVRLVELAIYVNYKQDESYTPAKISVRAGNSFHDIREVKIIEMDQPVGWVSVSLRHEDTKEYLRAYLIQLAVISNHQHGRDTHIRQIKIYGPHIDNLRALGYPVRFTTDEFHMYSAVR